MKREEISQMKPRLGQGRAGLRCKVKTPTPTNKPIVHIMESPPKVFASKSPKVQDVVIPIPNYTIPEIKSRGDASTRKTLQDMSREIPIYPNPVYQLPPKPVKTLIPEIPGSYQN